MKTKLNISNVLALLIAHAESITGPPLTYKHNRMKYNDS